MVISSEVDRILSASPAQLPLSRANLTATLDARSILAQKSTMLFPGTRDSQAALAGLLLRAGFWEESHVIAQDISSADGAYWHGIIHRIEPDSSNAGYWFRRVGRHPVFAELFKHATEILKNAGPKHWQLKSAWDPFLFIEWCDEAREKGGRAESAAIEIQITEWRLLFNWCATSNQNVQ